MKRAIILVIIAVGMAGCGSIDWFPAAKTDTTSTDQSSADQSASHNGSSTGSDTAFVNKCGVSTATAVTSNGLLVSGVSGLGSITVSGADSAYSINGGPYTKAAGLVASGQTVMVRHTSAAAGDSSSVVTTTVTIAGTAMTFKSDTNACPAGASTF